MEPLNLDNSPAARRERFTAILADQFEQPAYTMAASKHGGPCPYAELFVSRLIDGTADHSGDATQAACRALGIKKTLKALRAYLTEVRS